MRSMPSPTGRNSARLTLPASFPQVAGPIAAYDAALSEEAATALMLFLKERLNESDFAEAVRLSKGQLDDAQAMDRDDDLPTPKTDAQAADGARARLAGRVARSPGAESFAERFPGAARIKVG